MGIKNFWTSLFTPVDDFDTEDYNNDSDSVDEVYNPGYTADSGYTSMYTDPVVEPEQEPIETPYVDVYGGNDRFVQENPIMAQPIVSQHSAVVIMLTPYDIRTSQIVCDHIKEGHIVICNLTSSSNNQRVVDYISGGVYALEGKIEPTPVKTTFVCTPKSVELVVENNDVTPTGTKVSAI